MSKRVVIGKDGFAVGTGAGEEQDDYIVGRPESSDANQGGVEERKGDDGDNTTPISLAEDDGDTDYQGGVEERKGEDVSDAMTDSFDEGNGEIDYQGGVEGRGNGDNTTPSTSSAKDNGSGYLILRAGAGAGEGVEQGGCRCWIC